jgi:hypothetical protein
VFRSRKRPPSIAGQGALVATTRTFKEVTSFQEIHE